MVASAKPTTELQPISNFETNTASFARPRRRAADSSPAARLGTSPTAFRQFLNEKQRGSGATPPRKKPIEEKIDPTGERLAKSDAPRKTLGGFFRARHPLERLRDQGKLDTAPHINCGMFEAAEKLYTHFYQGGLGGIRAQDISRCVGAGDGGSCQFPRDERAMHHRQKFRQACKIMGWHEAAPYRGAGRLVVDVVCFEMGVKDAARVHCPGGGNEANLATGMDRLKEGLFALACLWNLI